MDGNDGGAPEPIPPDELRPMLGDASAAGYEATPTPGAPPPVPNPRKVSRLQSLISSVTGGDHGWGSVKRNIDTKELFIRHACAEGLDAGAAGCDDDCDDGDDAPWDYATPGPPWRAWSARVRARWSRLTGSTRLVKRISSKKWSDLVNFQDDFTLRECFKFFVVFLAVGALGFSYVFEHWTLLDSLYFTTVLLTTVGYGDITPTSAGGKLFATMFSLVGIVIFGLILGVLGSQLVEAEVEDFHDVRATASRAIESVFTRRSKRGEKARGEPRVETGTTPLARSGSASSLDSADSSSTEGSESYGRFSTRAVMWRQLPGFVPILVLGTAMAAMERWGWIDGVYYCVVTATTIGFGDVTPSTDMGKGFAIVLIPLTVGAMGYILGNVASAIVEKRRRRSIEALWAKSSKFSIEDIEAIDEGGDGGVSELEYVKYMLVAMQKVDGALIDELRKQFHKLDPNGDGQITQQDLQVMTAKRTKKVSRKLELYNYKKKLLKKENSGFVTAAQQLIPERKE